MNGEKEPLILAVRASQRCDARNLYYVLAKHGALLALTTLLIRDKRRMNTIRVFHFRVES